MARHCSDQSIGRSVRRLMQNPRGRRPSIAAFAKTGAPCLATKAGEATNARRAGASLRAIKLESASSAMRTVTCRLPVGISRNASTNRRYFDNVIRAHVPSAAKSHRAAAEYHGKNDHMKGNEHAMEAQKHSKVASAASNEAHAKSSSKK